MRTAVLSLLLLAAVSMGAIGFYSTKAAADRPAPDGYGITPLAR
ncbi:MAG: hypothetical protein WDZ83_19600 [Rhizobiaceae bacterium]